MNADVLLAYYERIVEAPDAVARLRHFVLDLAVRGRLVPQNSQDEPAQLLLERIFGLKAKLGLRVALDAQNLTSHPFELPSGWTWTTVGEVCSKTGSGSTPRGGQAVYKNAGIPFLRSQNVYDDGLRMEDVAYIDKSTHARMAGTAVKPGDLLLNITGGSIGRCCRIPEEFAEANVSQHVAILRPAIDGMQEFLHVLIRSPYFQSFVIGEQTGAGRGGLPKNRMDRIAVALPPLAEQHCIVAKVDRLMMLCDQLQSARTVREATRDRLAAASLARLNTPDAKTFPLDARFTLAALPALTTRPDQVRQLRQTILNLAVRGKLVPQNSQDESVEQTSRRFESKTLESGKQQRHMNTDFRNSEQTRYGVPDGWASVSLGELAVSMRYGTSTKCDYNIQGVPVLRIPNVSSGKVTLDDIKHGPLSPSEQADFRLEVGDLLLIRSNGSLDIVGRSAVITTAAAGLSFAGYLVRIRLRQQLALPEYVWLALNSSEVREQIERPIRSAVGLKNVNLTEFAALRFRLPPLAEQYRIVAKADILMTICDALEASLAAARAVRSCLLEAILRNALQRADMPLLEAAD